MDDDLHTEEPEEEATAGPPTEKVNDGPPTEEAIAELPEEDETAAEPAVWSGWLIPAGIGVLMLVVGMFLGYFGRGEFGPEARAARATQIVARTTAQAQATQGAQMMQYLVQNTRHFKGKENAPVTIIEFSDFQ